ncbi:MAG: peptide deformylase [Patescibacteria group bacterium]
MVKIVQKDDPILREIAKTVTDDMFGTSKLKKIVGDMKIALAKESDGVALAAPQIGVPLRLFVISGKITELLHRDKTETKKKYPDTVFINPEIIKLSKDKEVLEEGCLSVRFLYGKIERAKKAKIRAFDENGKKFEIGTSGLLAQIFQHETDHLDGKLFIDIATDVHNIPPNKIKIAFFGTPDRAVVILEALKHANIVPSLIITQPDRPQGRKLIMTATPVKIWAKKEKIAVLEPENLEDQAFVKTLQKGDFDLFVVVAYGKIIKENILDIPKRGSLNLHTSLLPKLRGSSPMETAILTDDKKTGVTIMLIDSLMDHGPIIAQKEVSLSKWPLTVNELEEILLKTGGELLAKTIPLWLEGKIKPRDQDHSQATLAKKIKKEDGLINFSDNPYKNYLKFLAYKQWPKTYFFVRKNEDKIRIIITEAEYKNGLFIIQRVIPEGKKEISFSEFEKNYKISAI